MKSLSLLEVDPDIYKNKKNSNNTSGFSSEVENACCEIEAISRRVKKRQLVARV
ncbi:MAG: hypothetical protein ABI237_08010 [Ginsengibacter sp.]